MDQLTRFIVTLLRYSEPMVPVKQRAWTRALRDAPSSRRPGDGPVVPESQAGTAPPSGYRVPGVRLRYGRPLLGPAARLWAGVLLTSCVILVTVLGVIFAHQTTADRLDHAIDSPIITWLGSHPGLAAWLAAPGSQLPAATLSAVIVIFCLFTGRLNRALLAVAAVPAAVGVNDGLCKPLFHRTYLGALSYPSGHTATMFALAATVALLLYVPPRSARATMLRLVIPAAACVLGGVVAVGVIGLRWHYFTDTVAGAAVGIGTVCGLALLLDLPIWLRQRSVLRASAGG